MNILSLLDEVQAIARTGLHFASGTYDRERYERLLQLTTNVYSDLLDLSGDELKARFLREVGYVTPKVGADAAIFNDKGEILLMERADGSGWCLPCGWVEPNEKPVEAAVREAREETGLEVEVKQLVGVFTRKASARNGPHSMIAVVHLCDVVGGQLRLSHEGTSLQYWAIDQMKAWHPRHQDYARAAHAMWKSKHLLSAVSD
jgi:ADP-ribose pyrophosphatase YjhB (NUDIX family)